MGIGLLRVFSGEYGVDMGESEVIAHVVFWLFVFVIGGSILVEVLSDEDSRGCFIAFIVLGSLGALFLWSANVVLFGG